MIRREVQSQFRKGFLVVLRDNYVQKCTCYRKRGTWRKSILSMFSEYSNDLATGFYNKCNLDEYGTCKFGKMANLVKISQSVSKNSNMKWQTDPITVENFDGYMYGEFGEMANLAGICQCVCTNSQKWQRSL